MNMNMNDEEEEEDVFYNDWNVISNEELDNEIAEINILYDKMMRNENILEREKVNQYIEIKEDKESIDLNNEIIEPNLEVIEPQNIITHNYIINNVFKDANNKKIIKNHKKVKSTYLTKMGFLGILLSVNLMVYIIYTNEISNRKMITY